MWKNWNSTGKIKAVFLLLLLVLNIIVPAGYGQPLDIFAILFPFFFGALTIPLISRFNAALPKMEIVKPDWNDQPFKLRRPLSFFHYASFLFMTAGAGCIIGAWIRYEDINPFGLLCISFGAGIFAGVQLAVKWLVKE